MGCYDTVKFRCPSCGTNLEKQTKMYKCNLDTYSIERMPIGIAYGVENEKVTCKGCNKELIIKLRTTQVSGFVREVTSEDDE